MTFDANKGGEWVTGIIGEPFRIDAEGKPIPNAPPEQPTETTGVPDFNATNEQVLHASEADPVLPGIFPDSGQIGGNDDETQKEIWEQMERGEVGADAGKIPEDAETAL